MGDCHSNAIQHKQPEGPSVNGVSILRQVGGTNESIASRSLQQQETNVMPSEPASQVHMPTP